MILFYLNFTQNSSLETIMCGSRYSHTVSGEEGREVQWKVPRRRYREYKEVRDGMG